jgi:hypothetical protein
MMCSFFFFILLQDNLPYARMRIVMYKNNMWDGEKDEKVQ